MMLQVITTKKRHEQLHANHVYPSGKQVEKYSSQSMLIQKQARLHYRETIAERSNICMGKMQCAYKWYIIIENFVFCCHLTRHNWFYHFQLLSVNPHNSIQVVEQWLVLPETGQQAFAHLAAQQVMILLEVQVQLARMMEMEIRQDSGLIHGRSVSVSSSLLHQHLLVWCIANDSHCKPPFQNLWSCYRTCCFH